MLNSFSHHTDDEMIPFVDVCGILDATRHVWRTHIPVVELQTKTIANVFFFSMAVGWCGLWQNEKNLDSLNSLSSEFSCLVEPIWVFPKIGGKPPKWMVYYGSKPY